MQVAAVGSFFGLRLRLLERHLGRVHLGRPALLPLALDPPLERAGEELKRALHAQAPLSTRVTPRGVQLERAARQPAERAPAAVVRVNGFGARVHITGAGAIDAVDHLPNVHHQHNDWW